MRGPYSVVWHGHSDHTPTPRRIRGQAAGSDEKGWQTGKHLTIQEKAVFKGTVLKSDDSISLKGIQFAGSPFCLSPNQERYYHDLLLRETKTLLSPC